MVDDSTMTPVLCVGRNKHGPNSRITSTVYPGRELLTYLTLKALWLLYIPPSFILKKCVDQSIYYFCMDLRTNRDYFPIQH